MFEFCKSMQNNNTIFKNKNILLTKNERISTSLSLMILLKKKYQGIMRRYIKR